MKHLVLIMILVLSTGGCFAENLSIDFGTGEWPPFSSEKLPEYGSATALVTAICKEAGIQPVYKFFPWKRAELKVARGEIFAAFPYAISEERKKVYDFSEPLFYGVNVFMHYNRNSKTKSFETYNILEDFRGYRIGGISGSFLRSTFVNAGLDYEPTTSIDQSIHKLVAGRLDFCIDDRLVLYDAIQRLYPNKIKQFKFLAKPFGKKTATGLLVSRDYPGARQLLDKFNMGLAIIKQNGEYDRIIKKYHMTR